ncbi:MAG: hypothetical protein RL536_150 [Candidatus Parcubacteria bacterium]|jgi:hypothetical protein
MTPEERSLLERTHKLVEENNEILRSIRRSNRFGTIMRVLYWVLILALSFGAYYFIQPYLSSMLGTYSSLQNSLQGLQGDVNSAQNAAGSIRDLLK